MKMKKILWKKIDNFSLDNSDDIFQFSERLARENGWDKNFTLRVIKEYKKFILLCCITQNGVTPSDAVDQAWHLHLTYTKSYWIDLCKNIIGKDIHHNPTKGGSGEIEKFDKYYTSTLALYEDIFGVTPPVDIWPSNTIRFADVHFQRVNLSTHKMIEKSTTPVSLIIGAVCIGFSILFQVYFWTFDIFLTVLCLLATIFVVLKVSASGFPFIRSTNNTATNEYSGGCGTNADGHVDSGCGSGCSGCSSSGCSGCGSGH